MNSPNPKPDDASTSPPLFKLATAPRPEPHIWGARVRVQPHESQSGHEQHEWPCQKCRLVRITVLPQGGPARREYRFGESGAQFEDEREPMCGKGGA